MKRDEEQNPDTAHYISIDKKERPRMHLGITERHYFEEYMTLKDRLLDRISQGEDIVLLVDGFFCFENVTNEQIRFFCHLKECKPFNLHLIIPVYVRYQSSDYHELLRTMNFVEDWKSVCFINERTLTNRRNNDTLDKRLGRAVKAVRKINGNGSFIYDHERRRYLPCEPPETQSHYEYRPYFGNNLFEQKRTTVIFAR